MREKGTPPGALGKLQQALTDLRDQGLGKAKSAAIDGLREDLSEALRLGFTRQEMWEALREVGYEGSYHYFAKKLHRLGITRSKVISLPLFVPTIVSRGCGGTDASIAVGENEEPKNSIEPTPLNEVEAQRRRLEAARRRGDMYRNPKPEPKKRFTFNPED